jgi:hypothetical protein
MIKTSLKNLSHIPIENIMALSSTDLTRLVREANKALTEAKNLKDWIEGIMRIKNSFSNSDHSNGNTNSDNQNKHNKNYIGGLNEQVTDY